MTDLTDEQISEHFHATVNMLDFARAVIAADRAARQECKPDRHPDDDAVDRFAERMKWKLANARDKGKSGWQDRAWSPEQISAALRDHVDKGDPTDVANYCMFLSARCEPITAQQERKPESPKIETRTYECWAHADGYLRWFLKGRPLMWPDLWKRVPGEDKTMEVVL